MEARVKWEELLRCRDCGQRYFAPEQPPGIYTGLCGDCEAVAWNKRVADAGVPIPDAKGITYLATPLTHSDPAIYAARLEVARAYTVRRISEGAVVFCPVSYSAPLAAAPPASWYHFDLHFLRACGDLEILTLPEWESSFGVQLEMVVAQLWGMPIRYVDGWSELVAGLASDSSVNALRKQDGRPRLPGEHEHGQIYAYQCIIDWVNREFDRVPPEERTPEKALLADGYGIIQRWITDEIGRLESGAGPTYGERSAVWGAGGQAGGGNCFPRRGAHWPAM